MRNYYKAGTWNVICQVCGKQVKSDAIIKRWDGVLVCKEDYEPRHILDFVRSTTERGSVPFVSPEPADVFVDVVYLQDQQAIAGIGVAGLAITGYSNPNL
jgi:hypothetical protein